MTSECCSLSPEVAEMLSKYQLVSRMAGAVVGAPLFSHLGGLGPTSDPAYGFALAVSVDAGSPSAENARPSCAAGRSGATGIDRSGPFDRITHHVAPVKTTGDRYRRHGAEQAQKAQRRAEAAGRDATGGPHVGPELGRQTANSF